MLQIQITWTFKDRDLVHGLDGIRIYSNNTDDLPCKHTELWKEKATEADAGVYTVLLQNKLGGEEVNFNVTVLDC